MKHRACPVENNFSVSGTYSLYILQSRLTPIPWLGTLKEDSSATAVVLTPSLWFPSLGFISRHLGSRLASAISWSSAKSCFREYLLLPLSIAAELGIHGAVSLYVPASSWDDWECEEEGKPLPLTLVVEESVAPSSAFARSGLSMDALVMPVILSKRLRAWGDNFEAIAR